MKTIFIIIGIIIVGLAVSVFFFLGALKELGNALNFSNQEKSIYREMNHDLEQQGETALKRAEEAEKRIPYTDTAGSEQGK